MKESVQEPVPDFNEAHSTMEENELSRNQMESSVSYASTFLKVCLVFILIWIVITLLCQRDLDSLFWHVEYGFTASELLSSFFPREVNLVRNVIHLVKFCIHWKQPNDYSTINGDYCL